MDIKNSLHMLEREAIENPEFENAGRVHDWRNYIPKRVMELWPKLSTETRAVAYLVAEKQADSEEWD